MFHFRRFTKNLSPDKLQLSAFKGSFEVNNIELNENVLMDLLELPVWMRLTKAHCNYASIKVCLGIFTVAHSIELSSTNIFRFCNRFNG